MSVPAYCFLFTLFTNSNGEGINRRDEVKASDRSLGIELLTPKFIVNNQHVDSCGVFGVFSLLL